MVVERSAIVHLNVLRIVTSIFLLRQRISGINRLLYRSIYPAKNTECLSASCFVLGLLTRNRRFRDNGARLRQAVLFYLYCSFSNADNAVNKTVNLIELWLLICCSDVDRTWGSAVDVVRLRLSCCRSALPICGSIHKLSSDSRKRGSLILRWITRRYWW